MRNSNTDKQRLKSLPGVDQLLACAQALPEFKGTPRPVLTTAIRQILQLLREQILSGSLSDDPNALSQDSILALTARQVVQITAPGMQRVVNATGVVVHTNLGRSPLADQVLDHIRNIARHYSNLEFDLSTGRRGSRYSLVESLICELTGAEAAMVVNNNAAAVLLCLDSVARGKEAVVSRGELVEIGGSFRIPDVMAKSGAILKEVGTTNRTHLTDYQAALTPETGLLLKVHTSNYAVVGFTASVPLKVLVDLGRQHHLPVMEDLGSGTLIDFTAYGLSKEPTIRESVATGADLVTFSGDKLLGGGQAGIIIGKKPILETIKQNPLTRALRVDKLTLAALEGTLQLYRDERIAIEKIPTLRMLTLHMDQIDRRAQALVTALSSLEDSSLTVRILDRPAKAGGGALPLLKLPSRCVAITVDGMTANTVECKLRQFPPAVLGRIEMDLFLMDMRTIRDDEIPIIQQAIESLLKKTERSLASSLT
ncbi:MAG: L-seryl-tRNA(Sec) selenium transferase [Deltaproteobacteria bacterium]|nr:L-seryl-tRNA(Sec) selenium transferase [Deltaproteobacteria bacterium]